MLPQTLRSRLGSHGGCAAKIVEDPGSVNKADEQPGVMKWFIEGDSNIPSTPGGSADVDARVLISQQCRPVMNMAFFTSFSKLLLNTYTPSRFIFSSHLTNKITLVLSISPSYFASDHQRKQNTVY